MIRKYMRTKIVEQRTEERREVICDGCGKIMAWGFFQVKTHHDRWGNDSFDSYETRHFCCKTCMDAFLDEYWSNPEYSDQADIEYCGPAAGATWSEGDEVETVILEEKT